MIKNTFFFNSLTQSCTTYLYCVRRNYIDLILYPQSSTLNHMLDVFPRRSRHHVVLCIVFFLISQSFNTPFPVSVFSLFMLKMKILGEFDCSENSSYLVLLLANCLLKRKFWIVKFPTLL